MRSAQSKRFAQVAAWIDERERIRIAKEVEDALFPWTEDPILGTYRFCNVRREDDRVTRWINKHIRRPYRDHSLLWFMLCAARQINWTPSIQELMDARVWPDAYGYNAAKFARVLDVRAKAGRKVFTGAYIITAGPIKGQSKAQHVARVTLGELYKDRVWWDNYWKDRPEKRSLQQVHARLMRHNGWGPFLAYQAVVDMRFTPLLELAHDRGSWAAAGPGTRRGLNRIFDRPVDYRLNQSDALAELLELDDELGPRTQVDYDFSDVPNICCEFDKYERARLGEGKPKAKYIPGRHA